MKGIPALGRRPAFPLAHSADSNADRPELFRISVEMFHEMIDAGILTEEDRCELIEGELIRRELMKPPHARVMIKLNKWLTRTIPDAWDVRNQLPAGLVESEPFPDFTIVGAGVDEEDRHPVPSEIKLLIEVAHSSLAFDRTRKLSLYARCGIPVYWIVNIPDRQIETHAQPKTGTRPQTSDPFLNVRPHFRKRARIPRGFLRFE